MSNVNNMVVDRFDFDVFAINLEISSDLLGVISDIIKDYLSGEITDKAFKNVCLLIRDHADVTADATGGNATKMNRLLNNHLSRHC